MISLLVIGGLNTVLSLIYYLRLAKIMCIDPQPDSRGPVTMPFLPVVYILLVSIPVIVLGIFPEKLAHWTHLAGLQVLM